MSAPEEVSSSLQDQDSSQSAKVVPMPSTGSVQQENIGLASLLALVKEWGPPAIAGVSDVALASGFVPPQYILAVRFFVLYCLLRNVIAASFAAVLIPQIIPTIIVFIMQQRFRSFRRDAQEKLKNMATAATTRQPSSSAGDRSGSDVQSERHPTSATRTHGARFRPGEVSGYDVSGTNDGEVVELSSWKADSAASASGGPGRARRRGL